MDSYTIYSSDNLFHGSDNTNLLMTSQPFWCVHNEDNALKSYMNIDPENIDNVMFANPSIYTEVTEFPQKGSANINVK